MPPPTAGSWSSPAGKLRLFSSPDLLHWTFESLAPGLDTECPDLFELPLDNDPTRTLWVLSGGGKWYQLGHFDGHAFTPTGPRHTMHHGPDAYATQTFSDAPNARRIGISWLFSWAYRCFAVSGRIENVFPTNPLAGNGLTIPVEYALVSTPDGPRLTQSPIPELSALSRPFAISAPTTLTPDSPNPLSALTTDLLDLQLRIKPHAAAGKLLLRIPAPGARTCTVGYDAAAHEILIDRRSSGFPDVPDYARLFTARVTPATDGSIPLRILLDHSSVELFAGHPSTALAAFLLPDPPHTAPLLSAAAGSFDLLSFHIHILAPSKVTS